MAVCPDPGAVPRITCCSRRYGRAGSRAICSSVLLPEKIGFGEGKKSISRQRMASLGLCWGCLAVKVRLERWDSGRSSPRPVVAWDAMGTLGSLRLLACLFMGRAELGACRVRLAAGRQ